MAVLLAAGCAGGTGPTATASKPAAASDGALPPPIRETLPNGMRLIIQDHRAAGVVAIYLWVAVGGRDEAADSLGYSHFQEHMLFKGTDRWGPGHVDRTIEGIGGRSNAFTAYDYTTFNVIVPVSALRTGIELLNDMAFRSVFDPKELDREREVIFEEARIETDNPRTAIVRQLYQLVFDGHPYGRPILGTQETMNAGNRERVHGYYTRHYTPENMALVVVGPVDPAEVKRVVLETFARAPATGYRRGAIPAPKPLTGRITRTVERPEQQAMLAMGWTAPRTDDPEGLVLDLLTTIIGGTESSRLVKDLRDRDRLVSSIRMGYASLQAGGIVSVRAELEVGDIDTVERRILDEIARVQESGVTEEERELALIKAESDHAVDTETVEGLAQNYGIAELTWDLDSELRYMERLRKITREQIQAAARRYLPLDRYARLTFVPRAPR